MRVGIIDSFWQYIAPAHGAAPPFLWLQAGGALLLTLLKEKASQCRFA